MANKSTPFYFLDALGWPVETVKGHRIRNFFRLLLHTRKITRQRPRCLDPEQLIHDFAGMGQLVVDEDPEDLENPKA